MIEQFGRTSDGGELDRQVRVALASKGSVLIVLNRLPQARDAFDELCRRAREAQNPVHALAHAQELIARMLSGLAVELHGAERYDDVIAATDLLFRYLDDQPPPGYAEHVLGGLVIRAKALACLDRVSDAIPLLREWMAREWLAQSDDEAQEPRVAASVAMALYDLGGLLLDSGQAESALEIADEILTRFGHSSELALQDWIARALRIKAVSLVRKDCYEQALAVEEDALRRYGKRPPSEQPYAGLDALLGKAWALSQLNRTHDAIVSYDELVSCYGRERTLYAREKIAQSLEGKAFILLEDGRNAEAIAVIDDLCARLARAGEPRLQVRLAGGLNIKALALERLNRLDEAIEIHDAALVRWADTRHPVLEEIVAAMHTQKANCLKLAGQFSQSVATWTEVAERYGDADSPILRDMAETALKEKASILAAAGSPAEGIVVADALIERARDTGNGLPRDRRVLLAQSLVVKGAALFADDRYDEALAVFDDVIERFGDAVEPKLRREVTQALHVKVVALDRLGREEQSTQAFQFMLDRFGAEALLLFEEIVDHFADASEPGQREGVAAALYSKAMALGHVNREREALATLTELITCFDGELHGEIPLIVAKAYTAREKLCSARDDLG